MWEYLVIEVRYLDNITSVLNEYGADGWENYMVVQNKATNAWAIFFKRPMRYA